jgi:hypothetical protein
MVELYAVRGDTGVAVVMLLADSATVVARPLAVVSGGGTTEVRPSSRLALRLFDAAGVRVFEGTSGTLDVASILDSTMTGSLTGRMQSLETADTLQLVGRFRALPLGIAAAGCGRTVEPSPT